MWSRHFWQSQGSAKSSDDFSVWRILPVGIAPGSGKLVRSFSISSGDFSYPGKNCGWGLVSSRCGVSSADGVAGYCWAGPRVMRTGPSRCRLHGLPSLVHNLQGFTFDLSFGGRQFAHSVYIDVAGISSPHFVQALVCLLVVGPASTGSDPEAVLAFAGLPPARQLLQNFARAMLLPSATKVSPHPAHVFSTLAIGRVGLCTFGRGGVWLNWCSELDSCTGR